MNLVPTPLFGPYDDCVWVLPPRVGEATGQVLRDQPPLTYCRPHPIVKRKRGEPEPFADLCSMCIERYFAMPMRVIASDPTDRHPAP